MSAGAWTLGRHSCWMSWILSFGFRVRLRRRWSVSSPDTLTRCCDGPDERSVTAAAQQHAAGLVASQFEAQLPQPPATLSERIAERRRQSEHCHIRLIFHCRMDDETRKRVSGSEGMRWVAHTMQRRCYVGATRSTAGADGTRIFERPVVTGDCAGQYQGRRQHLQGQRHTGEWRLRWEAVASATNSR